MRDPWRGEFHDLHGSSSSAGEPIPGIPRGSRAFAPLSAVTGGGLTGVALGLSAGPVGLRVGAGIGATIGLIVYCALARPRQTRPRWRRRPYRTLPFVRRATGWLLGITGVAAAVLTGMLIADDRINDAGSMRVIAISGGLFSLAIVILWTLSSGDARGRTLRYDMRRR
jgi:hypothetical protein